MPLMGGVFYDSGLITNAFDALTSSDVRHGIGAALRIVTPVGFSSFEYAFCLNPHIGDPKNGRFHFNFGFAF